MSAEETLESYQKDLVRIMSEKCPSDERHCTCVPHLKIEIERLYGMLRHNGICPICGVDDDECYCMYDAENI